MLSSSNLHAGEIHLHSGKVMLERIKRGDHLVELAIVLVLLVADGAQHVDDQVTALVTHEPSLRLGNYGVPTDKPYPHLRSARNGSLLPIALGQPEPSGLYCKVLCATSVLLER